MDIGKAIQQRRAKKRLTQARLAALTNIGASYISRIEAGENTPGLKTLGRIAKALGTTPSKLLEER
jgi:transcriptional regulator with XRE-family HTH domain